MHSLKYILRKYLPFLSFFQFLSHTFSLDVLYCAYCFKTQARAFIHLNLSFFSFLGLDSLFDAKKLCLQEVRTLKRKKHSNDSFFSWYYPAKPKKERKRIKKLYSLRGFWDLKKTELREICVSGTVRGPLLKRKSPTCTYISQKPW